MSTPKTTYCAACKQHVPAVKNDFAQLHRAPCERWCELLPLGSSYQTLVHTDKCEICFPKEAA